MNPTHVAKISQELKAAPGQVLATAKLLEEGGTVPFIARYRKEATGSLDEVAITQVRDRMGQLAELDDRRKAILESLAERELLTAGAPAQDGRRGNDDRPRGPLRAVPAQAANTRDHRQGSRPRAAGDAAVREPGGDRSARRGRRRSSTPRRRSPTRRPPLPAPATSSPSGSATTRRRGRGCGSCTWSAARCGRPSSPARKTKARSSRTTSTGPSRWPARPSHRMLAMRRGEAEGVLRLRIAPPEGDAVGALERLFVQSARARRAASRCAWPCTTATSACSARRSRARCAWRRRRRRTPRRSASSPRTCASCCSRRRSGQKNVLAIDPGFRTGCKVACLDRQGKLLHHDVIFPTAGSRAAGAGGGRHGGAPGGRLHDRGDRHRQRHREPRDRAVRPRPAACPRRSSS